MTSLTTLFVVGPEEYVEFNESMGSKAFLEHIWDQSRSPLKQEDTSASGTQLHSAGARISPAPPPRIEFPTVLRVRGRGNKYQPTGRYISWEELKQRNPMAVKDPPSLDDFIQAGAKVGTAERVEPGAFLKGEKRFRITKRPKGAVDVQESEDGWIGGASESVYAREATPTPSSVKAEQVKSARDAASQSTFLDRPNALPSRTLRKSRSGLSLSARLGIDEADDMPARTSPDSDSTEGTPDVPSVPQRGSRPPRLTLPDNRSSLLQASSATAAQTPIAQTPLSASHSPPETPLKHDGNKGRIDIPATPRTEELVAQQQVDNMNRTGLMLEPGNRAEASPITPTMPGTTIAPATASASTTQSIPARAARSQIDEMLVKLRQARSGFGAGGSGESMWATKKTEQATSSEADKTPVAALADERRARSMTQEAAQSNEEQEKRTKERTEAKDLQTANGLNSKRGELQTKPTSLFDRLGPKLGEVEESVKVKKERKRGGRAHGDDTWSAPREAIQKPSNAPTLRAEKTAEKARGGAEEVPAATHTPNVGKVVKAKGAISGSSEREDEGKSEPVSEPEAEPSAGAEPESAPKPLSQHKPEVAHRETPSTAATSVPEKEGDGQEEEEDADDSESTVHETEPSVGNETLSTINWADDDDDESLPELPEEWMKDLALSPTKPEKALSTGGSSVVSNGGGASDVGESQGGLGKRGSKRGGKGRSRKQEYKEERGTIRVPREPKGMRIAGQAKEGSNRASLAAVSPWERRAHASTSPPKAPMGMRIAGRAEATAKAEQRQHPSHPRELFPASKAAGPPTQPRRRGGSSVMPPNGTPLSPSGEQESIKPPKAQSRPRIATNGDGAFARLTKGVIGMGSGREGIKEGIAKGAGSKDRPLEQQPGAAERKARAKGRGGRNARRASQSTGA